MSIRFGKNGYPFIIDSRGNIIVHTTLTGNMFHARDAHGREFIREMCKIKNGKTVYMWRDPGEKEYREKLAIFRYIPEFDWIVGSSIYKEDFYEPLMLIRRITAITLLLTLAILFLLSFLYSAYIVNNLNRLIRGFRSGGAGDFQTRLAKTSRDEFGRLADYFNEFMAKLDTFKQERKRAEETLRNSEKRLADILNLLPDTTFAIDLDGRIILWNRAAEEYTHVRAEEILGKGNHEYSLAFYGVRRPILIDLVLAPSADIEKLYPSIKRDSGRVIGEGYTRNADGSEAYILGTAAPLYNSAGHVIGAIESIRDISERKRFEEALRKSEEQFRTLIENLNIGVVRTSGGAYSRFLQVNPAIVKIFGFDSPAELLNTEVSALFQNPAERLSFSEEVSCKGSVRDKEIAMKKNDGTPIWASISTNARYDEKGELTWMDSVIEDITERKKLEEQLQRIQKMEAIGTLAGGIAHDFNNILTAIIGYGNLLKLKMGEDSRCKKDIDEILAAAERATHLTQSLLAFSRKQVISPKPTDINEIVKQIGKLLKRIIGEDIELQTTLCDQELIVMADGGQLEQVLINLATNARDAMPNGGLLTIRSERIEITETHDYVKPGAYAVVSFSDTGNGMDEATRRRIFEPFFTTKEIGKGTGLGLSIVYGIVKQHNGEISVTSEPGKGTIIKLYFELVKSKSEKTEPVPVAPMIGGSATILIAEDDDTVRKLAKEFLENYGYTVIEAVDGEDAVARFSENRERIQLLLFDVVMPKKNGKEAYEEIRKLNGDVPVIFSSGYTADIINKRGILEAGVNFLQKPVTPRRLLAIVHEVLAQKKTAQ